MNEVDLKIKDFPKIQCPFVKINHNVTPEIAKGFEWIFEDGVLAVDKLHGTNICVILEDGIVKAIDNRANRLMDKPSISTSLKGFSLFAIKGILNAMGRGWIEKGFTGRIYGELIGPKINKNIHLVNDYMFVPFDMLKRCYNWNSWYVNKYPKNFESISEWFKELPSLFTKKISKKDAYAEGLVFYHPKGYRAKLRRDQFDWYKE